MNYVARLARINLDKATSEIIEVEAGDLRKYLGGAGMGQRRHSCS
jgi:hypothetical protein